MLQMIKHFFGMFSTLFMAGNAGANALLNVALVTEEMSKGYLEVQRIEQEQKVTELKAKLLSTTKATAKLAKVEAAA